MTPTKQQAGSASSVEGQAWLERLRQIRVYASPLGLLLAGLVVLGVSLRLYDFGFPATLQFDEHHFVENARGYLVHRPDGNDHPPLGKLIIAAGMWCFGDNSTGFRLPALFAGLLTIILGAVTAQRLFPARWAGPLAAGLLAADGFLIAYSRAALLDGFLAAAAVASLLVVSCELSLLWGCFAGVVLGFAASIKFSGVGVLLPLLFAVAAAKVSPRQKLITLAEMALVSASVYVLAYAIGLGMTGKPTGILDVVADTRRLLKHHSVLTDMKNPATSGWVTWVLPTRPLLLGITERHGALRTLSTLGNLATWWASFAIALATTLIVLRRGWERVLEGEPPVGEAHGSILTGFVAAHGRSVVAALLASIGLVAPWVLTHRDSYIYHFLPAYVPLVLLLCGALAWYAERRPHWVFAFTIVAVLVAAFYAPVWGYLPLTREAFTLRLFLPTWR